MRLSDMRLSYHPIGKWLYRAWLCSRLDNYQRSLHAIAAQRENDFHAERLLHRAISSTRSKLQAEYRQAAASNRLARPLPRTAPREQALDELEGGLG